jgi:ribosomal protein S18 acetylase RimI-like enzyme
MKWTTTIGGGDLVVEKARQSDAEAVLELHRLVLEERDFFVTEPHEFQCSVEQKSRIIWDFRHTRNAIFLVARYKGELVGMLLIQGGALSRMRHVGKLEIMVSSGARGLGVGKALLGACIEWGHANAEIEKIGLSVFATNERAVAFYRSFGFEEEGRRVGEYKLDDGTYRDDVLMYRWVR